MFIFNFKVNGSKIFKNFFIVITILMLCILSISIFKVFNGANKSLSSCIPQNKVHDISAKNYTNILKAVHDDIDSYVGTKIHFSGYIYRVNDFNSNQFVLARDMVISSDFQTVIVGFLCECDEINNFSQNSWIDITGEITKGNYHGDMPIIKIISIKGINPPKEDLVYPPDESYIPTSGLV